MESESELLFELFLAEKLGMTLRQIRQMDNHEFLTWNTYYARKAQQAELDALKGA